jgi:hypothetical protein
MQVSERRHQQLSATQLGNSSLRHRELNLENSRQSSRPAIEMLST